MGYNVFEKVSREEIEAVVYGLSKHPFDVLGAKKIEPGLVRICCFYPDAVSATVKLTKNSEEIALTELHSAGVFGTVLEMDEVPSYTVSLGYRDGNVFKTEDAYAYPYFLPEQEIETFNKGYNYEIYRVLGSHKTTVNGTAGVAFAVWAPNALRVSIVGDFNLWDERRNPMEFDEKSGVYRLFIPGLDNGTVYKYAIRTTAGETVFKADPYANYAEMRPNNASIVYDISDYKWTDKSYMNSLHKKTGFDGAINIYEVHLGSWKKPTEDESSFYNYRELAVMLADYCKEMGYTHVELLPVMEHPFDGSWGYQVTGYYAPTSRFGEPKDFMFLVDYLHKHDIGVILDWVPAHFPKDAFGLAKFDGTCLYEHWDRRKGEHPHWGTLIYNLERPEVSNFLIANALYWVEMFHVDGIRMDAVASMLYLDYGKEDGQWVQNKYGGNENLDAIEFLKHLNSVMSRRNPGVAMIAEESTAWPNVTGNVEENNSLGFAMKWNMGWMNDFLKYMQQDPLFKKGVHGCLTFSMMYAYSERFVMVFSHDEVVHGKGSMINKMPGDYWQKFANLRLAYGFMYGHPGKKLLFMGQDFAQFAEWNEAKSLDWQLISEYEKHDKMHEYCKELFHMYINNPELSEQDNDPDGFEWMSCMDADRSIVSFIRKSRKGKMKLFVCNFTPVVYENFRQAVPVAGKYKEVLNSDNERFGGSGVINYDILKSEEVECDGKANSIVMKLPPLAVTVFDIEPEVEKKQAVDNKQVSSKKNLNKKKLRAKSK